MVLLMNIENEHYFMDVVKVSDSNIHVYKNLYQAYAAEFSKIVQDKPDKDGLFKIYPEVKGDVSGFILYIDGLPAAFTAIIDKSMGQYEVADFYVLPYFRKNKVGKQLIFEIFTLFGGSWEIKQVNGADHAVKFWRDVITEYTNGNFMEDRYQDKVWGEVTRQQFSHQTILPK